MRVNMVVPEVGDGESGQGRYTESLAAALVLQGVDVRYASFRTLPMSNRRPVLKVVPIGVEGGVPDGIYHFVRIKGLSALLARGPHPSIVTVHDLGVMYCPEDQVLIDSIVRRQLLRLSLRGMRRADHFIAVSDFTRSCLLRAGLDADRVTTIRLGVDGERFWPRAEAVDRIARRYDLDLPASIPIILYVGNELPRKNLGRLVEALARLRDAGVAFRWLKVGASNYPPGRVELERLIDGHQLGQHVTIVNRVAEEDLPFFYSAASVFVQPSVWEGFGLPVLEAMACGAPVVASTSGALPEVCGDAAVLVDAHRPEEIARGIERILTDTGLAERLRTGGLARAAQFTWAETAARTRNVYECVGKTSRS